MTAQWACRNGEWIPADKAAVPVWDAGLVHGVAVTEFLRTFGGQLFCLEEHLQRLMASARAIHIELPYGSEAIANQLQELVRRNFVELNNGKLDLGAIVFATAGANASYVGRKQAGACQLYMHTFVLRCELWSDKYRVGQRLQPISRRSLPAESIDPKIKSRSRLHWYLGDCDARQIDPQSVAIWQDDTGAFTETAAANIAFVIDEAIVTPRSDRVLNGVSRQFAKRLAVQLDIPWEEGDVTPEGLSSVREAFLMSTPYCLLPITQIGDWQPRQAGMGPVCQQLLDAWSNVVGVDIVQQARMITDHQRQNDESAEPIA